jgi:hypothetical protein
MTAPMRAAADALPSAIPAITEPWLGTSGLGTQLVALGAWSAAALVAIAWLARRRGG